MRYIFELLVFNPSLFMLLSNSYDVNWRSGQVTEIRLRTGMGAVYTSNTMITISRHASNESGDIE